MEKELMITKHLGINTPQWIIDKCLSMLKEHQKANEWISVEDRLPEIKSGITDYVFMCYNIDGKSIVGEFFYAEDEYGKMWYSKEKTEYSSDPLHAVNPCYVTHWQPLPSPPQ